MSLNPPKSPVANTSPDFNVIPKDLTKQRGILRGRLTKLLSYVSSFENQALSRTSKTELKLRIEGAPSLLNEFNEIQVKLDMILPESAIDEQLDIREDFETKYYGILAQAKCILNDDEVTASYHTNSSLQSVKLPTISLPTFDGSYEHWLEFRDTFLSLVHNSREISSIQKFHYLKSSLKSSAELVIDSLEISADNYAVAWELLLNRYNNSRLLVHNHVKALFSIVALNRESPVAIRKLIDTILKNLRALKTLGEPTDSWDTLIIYLVISKVDQTTEREWEQHKSNILHRATGDSQSVHYKVDDLLLFLKNRADMLETLLVTHSKSTYEVNKHSGYTQNTRTVHSHVSTNKPLELNKRKRLCLVCNANHPLYSCQKFLDFHLVDKLRLINDNKLCNNCLHPGHTADICRYGPCRKCCKKHNTIIHHDEVASNEGQGHTRAGAVALYTLDKEQCISASSDPSHNETITHTQIDSQVDTYLHDVQCTHTSSSAQPVLLSTAIVEISDNIGNYHQARVLLDSGSQRSFITKSLCDRLNYQLIQSTQQIRGIGNAVTQCTQTCNVTIRSRTGDYTSRIPCLVLTHITSTLPSVPMSNKHFNIPSGITLADPIFYQNLDIDMLIGADIFWDLLSEGKMRLPNGPFLKNTKLGWIISGPIFSEIPYSKYVHCNFTEQLENIDTQIRKFWELEELFTKPDVRSDEEKACENHFVQTTTRDVDGRFLVRIPFKTSPDALGETYAQAERRFIALERRLQHSPSYQKLYTEFIDEYIRLGHMTHVHTHKTPHYFMPHHGVFREHSTTTKLRVVFDASASSTTNRSLNDLQMVGSPIQGDLVAILLRFREHRYVACADIEKMYRQVLIDENQRDLQLILWRDNPSKPLETYRLNTVTYGTASAPFLSVRCLKQLASECNSVDVARTINEDYYVDDMITSEQSIDKLLYICNETTKVLASGCFPLRKWVFNFECDDSKHDITVSKELSLGEDSQCKMLGLGWYNKADDLNFHTDFKNDLKQVSKRTILSNVSQIFDPLGLLSPTVILIKALIQRLWLLKLDWDKPVPSDVMHVWYQFVNNLSVLNNLRVPRHAVGLNPTRIELHIFTDASQIAYGTCAYVRTISNDLNVTIRLLCAKGKVAPLKPVSIPRLELCGALLGARLYAKITESLRTKFDVVKFWTDSTIVLCWLRMSPNLLKTFVQNRTAEIHELAKDKSWLHVSGKHNPADLVSRGMGLGELSSSTLWWEGPEFLRDPSLDCTNIVPDISLDHTQQHDLPEVKSTTHSLLTNQDTHYFLFPFTRFSQFSRMKRTAAYVLRFLHNLRYKNNKRLGALSVDELSESLTTLARLSQMESFPDEYSALKNQGKLHHKHNLAKLNLFIDGDMVARVGGRLENSSDFDFNKKHPILISAKHHFAILLFRYEHNQLLHAGPQALLFSLREAWWPIGGRNLARHVVHKCVICTRQRGKTIAPLMGNLPKQRLTPGFPFMRVGVDYAGPVLILNRKGRGAKTIKSYICLFICLVTRAIHLELVSDLTTDAYLLSLKRFISRRGKPAEILSDNGKNFVGLMNDFTKFISKCSIDITDYAASQNIKFTFIPPYAPHFGGLWEAGVKSCKYHLRRVVGNAHLTFEEFSTVLTQVEAVLNSRPLSPMSTDPRDFLPLSPAHFLVGRPLTAPVTANLENTPSHRLTRYQRVEQIRQHFWIRWSKEYISELQTRIKWKDNKDDIKPDSLVLIKDDNLPPLKWHLGRIISTCPGKDGISRVADIRTGAGVVKRAFSKICPLLTPADD